MDWDSEVERRLKALECSTWSGTNLYVCLCAKIAWIRKQEANACKMTPEEEKEWQHFQAKVSISQI